MKCAGGGGEIHGQMMDSAIRGRGERKWVECMYVCASG